MENKTTLSTVLFVIGALAVPSVWIYVFAISLKNTAVVHAKREADCKALDLKYGDVLQIKYGFYEGVYAKAIAIYGKSIATVKTKEGLELQFLCEDLRKASK